MGRKFLPQLRSRYEKEVKAMGNLKNYIIKKLGGYTAEEYRSAANIRMPKIRKITHLDLVDVKAETAISRVDVEYMETEFGEMFLRDRLMQQLTKEIEPFVQFTFWEPGPFDGFIAEAKLRVLRPKENGRADK